MYCTICTSQLGSYSIGALDILRNSDKPDSRVKMEAWNYLTNLRVYILYTNTYTVSKKSSHPQFSKFDIP